MDDPKKSILKILEIIDYKKDREKFAQGLLDAIFKKAVSSEEYQKAVEKATGEIIERYLKAILPTLSEDQKNQIEKYFTSF